MITTQMRLTGLFVRFTYFKLFTGRTMQRFKRKQTCDASKSINISIRSLCASEDSRNISISFLPYAYAYVQ